MNDPDWAMENAWDVGGAFLPPRCKKCGSTALVAEIVESRDGAHDDQKITCRSCRFVRWVEGSDS